MVRTRPRRTFPATFGETLGVRGNMRETWPPREISGNLTYFPPFSVHFWVGINGNGEPGECYVLLVHQAQWNASFLYFPDFFRYIFFNFLRYFDAPEVHQSPDRRNTHHSLLFIIPLASELLLNILNPHKLKDGKSFQKSY